MNPTRESVAEYLSAIKAVAIDKPVKSAHWAFFKDRRDLKAFRLEAERRGYQLVLSNRCFKRTPGCPFVAVFTAFGLLSPDSFLNQVLEAKDLVEQFHGEYDGYEHSAYMHGDDTVVCDYRPEPLWVVAI